MSTLHLIKKRTQKTEALIIKDPSEEESYANLIKREMAGVNLKELNIQPKAQPMKTGAILLEVDDAPSADKLAEKLHQVLGAAAVIHRPT